MLDYDLAELYETDTTRLKEALRRNNNRFPADFMFEHSKAEFESLRSQIASSKRGGTRYMPFAFTEQGVAMLSRILKSKKAIQVNIVFIRQYAISHKDLFEKLAALETKYNKQFKDVYEALDYLLSKDKQEIKQKNRRRIGF